MASDKRILSKHLIGPLYLESIRFREFGLGMILIFVSFFMPVFFNVNNFSIMDYLLKALRETEKTDLINAAVRLVFLNMVRGIPHYVGAFFIGESISLQWRGHRAWEVNSVIILVILLLTYWGIGTLHGVQYDFGLPAVMACMFVVLFRKLHYRYIALTKKAGMVVLTLTAFQFLDIMPMMSRFPIGRGETSMDIKTAAAVLESETVLDTVGFIGLVMFILFALVAFFQLREENTLRELTELRAAKQEIEIRNRLSEMKNRTYQEMQYLVHDLKSPLTSVQTLVGVMKMNCEVEKRTKDIEFLDHIERSVERMSQMISEILYQEQLGRYKVSDLVKVVLAQSSVNDYAGCLRVEDQVPEAYVRANQFLFTRALINLIDNSAHAMTNQLHPDILLKISRTAKGRIEFAVEDNGSGIAADQLDLVWDKGISGRSSSGMGLAFVRNVVEQMQGKIKISSTLGTGTTICVLLQEEP